MATKCRSAFESKFYNKKRKCLYDVLGDDSLVPMFFKVRDSFPYAKSGKRDTKALSLEEDGYIFKSFSKKDIKTMKKECK